jgi:hypothetical protein
MDSKSVILILLNLFKFAILLEMTKRCVCLHACSGLESDYYTREDSSYSNFGSLTNLCS